MDTPDTTAIAAEGDVTLIIGQEQTRYRVSSGVLKQCSPVFASMLSESFSEGKHLADTGSIEIKLPEDNHDAARIMLMVFHGRNGELPLTLNPVVIFEVAILADKYDCLSAMRFAGHLWCVADELMTEYDISARWLVAIAACILEDEEAFARRTADLILNHSGTYYDLARANEGRYMAFNMMGYKMAAMLEAARDHLQKRLLTALIKLELRPLVDLTTTSWNRVPTEPDEIQGPVPSGATQEDNFNTYMDKVDVLSTCSLAQALNMMDNMGYLPPASPESIRNAIQDGICLWCLRHGPGDTENEHHDD